MNIHNSSNLSIRISGNNPNHHLYSNNGSWWIHYTIHPTPLTVERIRKSLKTRDLRVARQRRDSLLGQLSRQSSSTEEVL